MSAGVKLEAWAISFTMRLKSIVPFDTMRGYNGCLSSSSFRKKVRGFVEKAKSGFAHSAEIPVEERRRRLERFLDERPMIRRKEYTQLTGLLKNKALNELNGWVKEGVLDTIGSGSHIIYVRANTGKD